MKIKTQTTILLITLLCCNFSILYADYDSGGFTETLLMGRHPNARKEAMGKTGVASNGYLYAGLLNPACIGGLEGITVNYAFDPDSYYLLEDKNWHSDYTSIGMKFNDFSFAFDYYRQDLGSWKTYDETGEYTGSNDESISLLSLIASYEVSKNLYLGTAFRITTFDIYPENSKNGYLLDLGLLKKIDIISNSNFKYNMNIGASISNILNAEIAEDFKEDAPVNLRIGLSNNFLFNHTFLNRATVNAEIFKIFNPRIKGEQDFGIHSGLELNVFKYLLLRCGYYYELINDYGNSGNKDHLSELTYGTGVVLPINEILPSINVPVEIGFDFTVLEQPSYTEGDEGKWDNFYNYSFTVKWKFDSMK